jgi:hypothetical protein
VPLEQITGWFLIGGMVAVMFVGSAWARRRPVLRSLSGWRVLPGQQSRSIESGQRLHISLGTGGMGGNTAATTLAGLTLLETCADEAAATDTPPIVTVADPTTLAMAQDVLRRAYIRHNNPSGFDPRSVRYVAASPLPYAAGVMDILSSEETSANVMSGVFGSEAVFLAEEGARQGMLQVAAAADPTALSVLYPSANHLLIGEELFAVGAYVGERPSHVGSLLAQDVVRWILVLIILAASLGSLAQKLGELMGGLLP